MRRPSAAGRGLARNTGCNWRPFACCRRRGLPLNRIHELLFGRTLQELRQIEEKGLAEMTTSGFNGFRPTPNESWSVAPLNEEFMLVSRRGRRVSAELRERLLGILEQTQDKAAPLARGKKRSNP